MRVNDAFPFAPDPIRLEALLWKARGAVEAGLAWTQRMIRSAYDVMRSKAFRKRSAYRRMFLAQDEQPHRDAATVLSDLARFCNAFRTTAIRAPGAASFDPIAMAKAEGRREVWILIQSHLGVSDTAMLRLLEQESSYE